MYKYVNYRRLKIPSCNRNLRSIKPENDVEQQQQQITTNNQNNSNQQQTKNNNNNNICTTIQKKIPNSVEEFGQCRRQLLRFDHYRRLSDSEQQKQQQKNNENQNNVNDQVLIIQKNQIQNSQQNFYKNC